MVRAEAGATGERDFDAEGEDRVSKGSMKARERLRRIRDSKSWTERLALAQDHLPGTEFDCFIPAIMDALRYLQENPKPERSYMMESGCVDTARLASDTLEGFGRDFAVAIQMGNSGLFRKWAKAIDQWHSHEPSTDKLRAAIVRVCVPPRAPVTMRNLLAKLRERSIPIGEDTPRVVRRICRELKIQVRGTAGRPKKK